MPVFDELPTRPAWSVRIPWWRLVSAVVATTLVVTGAVLASRRDGATAPVSKVTAGSSVRTATIERTDLSTTVSLPGQLGFGTEKPVRGAGDGQVTWLPRSGRTIGRGEAVFRVDDRPVTLFLGHTPLFRRLADVGTVGRDVRVVADNLRALGYSIGYQPAVGSTISPVVENPPVPKPADSSAKSTGEKSSSPSPEEASASTSPEISSGASSASSPPPPVEVRFGDAVLTPALVAAIRRWQADIGALRTGVIEVGQVVVQPEKIRVAAVTAQLGDPAAGPLISVTGTSKQVSVQARPAEMDSVRGARTVSVTLPDGRAAAGRIANVSRVVTSGGEGGDGGDQPRLTAVITLNRPSLVRTLDAAPVQVQFVSRARKSVLAVPVGALLALSGGGYAVQVSGGGLIPVTTGLFAQGQVEITGDGVEEGTSVVTTS